MKIQTLFFIALTLCCATLLSAQQILLSGQVSLHNSQYQTGSIEYVNGASVSAAFGGATETDSQGDFELVFAGLTKGELVELVIEKGDLEVVNERDILHAVLGRSRPLRVYMAPEGQLAQAQTELYEVSLQAITVRHDALIVELRKGGERSEAVIADLEQQLNREIEHRYAAEDLLNEQLEALKEQLPETTKRLAQVNLDFVSDNYRAAYELYKTGEIEEALEKLNEVALSQQSANVLATLDEMNANRSDYELALALEEEKAYQIVESYQLKAEAYNLVFDYRGAANVYQKAVDLLEALKDGKEDLELADAYRTIGGLYRELGEYSTAFEFIQRHVEIKEALLAANDIDLIIAYTNLASVYHFLGDYINALNIQKKALNIQNQHNSNNPISVANVYNNLAVYYQSLGKFQEALKNQLLTIRMQEENTDSGENIAISYSNLSGMYMDLGMPKQAIKALQTAIHIAKDTLVNNHPKLAILYNNLADFYLNTGEYEKAIDAQQKDISILEEILENNHPMLATSYSNLGIAYLQLGVFDKALIVLNKAIDIRKRSLPANHPALAIAYSNLGGLYQHLEDYVQALSAHRKAVSIIEQQAIDPALTVVYYDNLAASFYYNNQLDSAFYYGEKAYQICENKLPLSHENRVKVEKRLGIFWNRSGLLKLENKQYQEARIDFQEELIYTQDSAQFYNKIGYCYHREKDYENAVKYYELSYEANTVDEVIYLINSGIGYANLGNENEVKKRFERLELLIPDNEFIYITWCVYYTIKNEPEIALNCLEEAIDLGFADLNWIRTEEALEPLRTHPRYKALLEKAPDE